MWDHIGKCGKPVVLYGTGNACEKILDELNAREIAVSGIFASDGFVRGKVFHGFDVGTYREAKERFGEMLVLLCFGSHLPEVIENVKRIASEQELLAPDLPVAGEELFTPEFYARHEAEFARARSLLADEESRRVFDAVVAYKLSGNLSHLFACESPDDANWALLGLDGRESVLDLGAYNGDTVRQFLRLTGQNGEPGRRLYSHITAVEPDPRNYRKLCENEGYLPDCDLLHLAAGAAPGERFFFKNSGRGSHVVASRGAADAREKADAAAGQCAKGTPVRVATIDGIAQETGQSFSFIKMDLEGEESAALCGGAETIARCKPKLLISAYHRSEDLFALPLQLLAIRPDYSIYLRHSPCIPAWEVNYYCV